MPFQIVRNDITKVTADAIVNTANPEPTIGSGTDRAIYKAAGKNDLLAVRKKIGTIRPGEVHATPAFKLNAKYILHTVGPVWDDGKHMEREVLHDCYKNALLQADALGCNSIAFPLIATGNYGFPKDEALNIALKEIGAFLLTHEMDVILVVFDRKAFELSSDLTKDIEEFIDENGVGILEKDEYAGGPSGFGSSLRGRREKERRVYEEASYAANVIEDAAPKMSAMAAPMIGAVPDNLDDILNTKEDTFQQRLFKLIDESGMTDVEVYKGANIDRKVFSKIRSNVNYKPTKKTAIALCISLHLDEETMKDLLARAEFALSPSSKFDLVIQYFVANKEYNLMKIEAALFEIAHDSLDRVKG